MNRAPLLALACFVAVGCEEKKRSSAQPAPPGCRRPPPRRLRAPPPRRLRAPPPLPSGDRGDVKGTVVVTGKVPAMEDLKRNSDAFCAKKQMKDESVVAGKKGELANVRRPHQRPAGDRAARREGDARRRTTACTARACRASSTGRSSRSSNGDPVLHNVHTYKARATLFNLAQVPGTPEHREEVHAERRDAQVQVRRAPVDDRLRLGAEQRLTSPSATRTASSRSRTSPSASGTSRRGTSASAPRRARSPSPRASRPK